MANLSSYEAREIAFALLGGGWETGDKGTFIAENAKQDEENILSMEDIDKVFEEMQKIEKEKDE